MKISKMLRFSVAGVNHGHIHGLVKALVNAGGIFVDFYSNEEDLAQAFAKQ